MPTSQVTQQREEQRTYRCHYTPLDRDGAPVASESGVLPFVQVRAADAESARIAAYTRTGGCPIVEVERLEAAWPGAPLTPAQRREQQAMQRALKAGTVARWPAGIAAAAAAVIVAACGGGDPEQDLAQRDVGIVTPVDCAASGVCA